MPQMSPISWESLSFSTFVLMNLISLATFFFVSKYSSDQSCSIKYDTSNITWLW